jgi:hypothetical protein
MKKFLIILLAAAFTFTAVSVPSASKAQAVKTSVKTITAADTIVYASVGSNLKTMEYNLTKSSGTAAGKVYLDGSNFGLTWTAIDSLTLSNVTTVQTLTHTFTATTYLSFRFRCTNTSSATAAILAGYVRRPDE